MASFDQAIPVILHHEGGYVDDPADPGGATNYGISLRWYLDHGHDLDGDGDIDAADIRQLTPVLAAKEYREHFWLPVYDLINDQRVATKVFDMHVNMGEVRAHKLAQQALRALGHLVDVDGVFGRLQTLPAVNTSNPDTLLLAIVQEQVRFYRALAAQKPKLAKFLPGWTIRAGWPLGRAAAFAVV